MCHSNDFLEASLINFDSHLRQNISTPQWRRCPGPMGAHMYDKSYSYRLLITFEGDYVFSGDGTSLGYSLMEVSGLYGPGAYVSWLMMMLSVLSTSIFKRIPESSGRNETTIGVNADMIASILYIFVAAGDLVRKSFYRGGTVAAFVAAAQTVWGGIIFLLAAIGPNRTRPLDLRQAIFYIAFWACTASHLLARKWLIFNFLTSPVGGGWRPTLEEWALWSQGPFRLLLSIPMIMYYRFSRNARSNRWKFVGASALLLFYHLIAKMLQDMYDAWNTWFTLHGEDRSIWFPNGVSQSLFRPIIHPEYFPSQLQMIIPVTQNRIMDLDQLATLITTAVVLSWQWKIWRLAGRVAKIWNIRLFARTTPVEDVLVDLEEFSSEPERVSAQETS